MIFGTDSHDSIVVTGLVRLESVARPFRYRGELKEESSMKHECPELYGNLRFTNQS